MADPLVRRVAVIGSGVAGLTAAYVLVGSAGQPTGRAHVKLCEAHERLGGSMAFRDGRMGVDQILAVRPGAPHPLPAVGTW
jgi:predicted NAD/FAD-binding protein